MTHTRAVYCVGKDGRIYHSCSGFAIKSIFFYKLESGHGQMQVNQWKRVTLHVLGPVLAARRPRPPHQALLFQGRVGLSADGRQHTCPETRRSSQRRNHRHSSFRVHCFPHHLSKRRVHGSAVFSAVGAQASLASRALLFGILGFVTETLRCALRAPLAHPTRLRLHRRDGGGRGALTEDGTACLRSWAQVRALSMSRYYVLSY